MKRKVEYPVGLPKDWVDNDVLKDLVEQALCKVEREVEVEDNMQVVIPFGMGRLMCIDYKDGKAEVSFPLMLVHDHLTPI